MATDTVRPVYASICDICGETVHFDSMATHAHGDPLEGSEPMHVHWYMIDGRCYWCGRFDR